MNENKQDCRMFSDADLKKYQRQALSVCAFTESGIRSGISTPKFAALAAQARAFLQTVEAEFFARHPEAKTNRDQQFLRICEGIFDGKNFDDFGKDPAAATQQYFVEYNTPAPGKKLVTCRKVFLEPDGTERNDQTRAEYAMTPVDVLFAELENAMDEYAETLPDPPAAEGSNANKQES